jgi:hypothetical protein
VHGALKQKKSRCGDGKTLEMSWPVACEVWDLDGFLKWMDGLNLVCNKGIVEVCGVVDSD